MKLKYHFSIFVIIFFILLDLNGKSQVLYIGANYHQHDDKKSEKIKKDISLMKAASLNMVRMGNLVWDSYEPDERGDMLYPNHRYNGRYRGSDLPEVCPALCR